MQEGDMMQSGESVIEIERQALHNIRATTINPDISTTTCLIDGNLGEMYRITPQTFTPNVNLYTNNPVLIEYRAPFQSRVMNIRESRIRTGLTFTNTTANNVLCNVYPHKSLFRDVEFIGLGAGGKEFVKKENNNLDVIMPHLIPLLCGRDIGDNNKTTSDDNFHTARKFGWKKRNAQFETSTTAGTSEINILPNDALYLRDAIILAPGGSKTIYYDHYLREFAGSLFLSAESQFYLPYSESVLRLYTNNNITPASNTYNVFEYYELAENPYSIDGLLTIDLDYFTQYHGNINQIAHVDMNALGSQLNFVVISNDGAGTITGENFLTNAPSFLGPDPSLVITLNSCDWYIPRLTVVDPMHGILIDRFLNEGRVFTYPVIKRIYQGNSSGKSFSYSQFFNVADLKSIKYIITAITRPQGPTFFGRNNITKPSFLYSLDDIQSGEFSINGYYYAYGTDNRLFNIVNTYSIPAANANLTALGVQTYKASKKSNIFVNNYRHSYEKYLIEPQLVQNKTIIGARTEDTRNFLDTAGLIIMEWDNKWDNKTQKVVLTDDSANESNIEYIGVTDNRNYQLSMNLNFDINWPAGVLDGLVGTFTDNGNYNKAPVDLSSQAGSNLTWGVEIYIIGHRQLTIKGAECRFDYEQSANRL